jgi:hypothetical protein
MSLITSACADCGQPLDRGSVRILLDTSKPPYPWIHSRCREKPAMDPNVTLTALRDAIRVGDLEAVTEHFQALDGWLSRGGFKPLDWTRPAP